MVDGRHTEKSKNAHISALVLTDRHEIWRKDSVTQTDPPNPIGN